MVDAMELELLSRERQKLRVVKYAADPTYQSGGSRVMCSNCRAHLSVMPKTMA